MDALMTFKVDEGGFLDSYAPVRTILKDDGTVWFVARDVADALSYKWKGSSTIKHVPVDWRGLYTYQTTSGPQEMAILSEHGLYFFLNRSDKPGALPFQTWVNGTVLPQLRQQSLPVQITPPVQQPPMTQLQLLQATISALVAQEQQQAIQSEKIASLEQKMDTFEVTRQQSIKVLSELPEPSVDVPDPSLRILTSRVVREYAKANGIKDYSILWNKLYMEYRDAFHIDLKVIAENRGIHVLDLAEEREYLPQLYALAVKLFKHRLVSPTGGIQWSESWIDPQ